MVKIWVFGKKNCAACQTTKNKFNHFIEKYELSNKAELSFFDMETIDGLSEGADNDVLKTIFRDDENNVLARWDGEVPNRQDYEKYLKESGVASRES